jgi:hypothetical protein
LEANSERAEQLAKLYEDRPDIKTLSVLVEIDGENSLSGLLRGVSVSADFDFLSIDIDGADYHMWKSLKSEYAPRVVCIEFNPTIPNDVVFIQEPDCSIHRGSSLLALVELGTELGYTLVVTTTFNAIFVKDSLVPLLPAFDNSLDALHSSSMITEIFQTYEGELIYCGPKKLIWHKIPINPQKMQVLCKKDRKFPFSPLSYAQQQDILSRKRRILQLFDECATRNLVSIRALQSSVLKSLDDCKYWIQYQFLEEDVSSLMELCICVAEELSTQHDFESISTQDCSVNDVAESIRESGNIFKVPFYFLNQKSVTNNLIVAL